MRDLESENFLKVVKVIFLKQAVSEPTRGNNILELILVNNENMIEGLEAREN